MGFLKAQFLVLCSLRYNINDVSSSTNSAPRLYADDTCLISQDESISNLKYKIKGEINAVNKWMIANKLTLNMSKSNVIIINSNINGKSSKNCYNDVLPITIVKNAKYLGVTFDKSLSFDCPIKKLVTRLSRTVGILAKVKPFLNTKALLNLYYAIFHWHLQYGLITWSSTFKSYLKKVLYKIKLLKLLEEVNTMIEQHNFMQIKLRILN